jgi:hypothetical protein
MRISQISILPAVFSLLSGCSMSSDINFNRMTTTPTASITGDKLTIKLGTPTHASASWVWPKVKIDNDMIYVFGNLRFRESQSEYSIRLPETRPKWNILWVNQDGSTTPIPLTESCSGDP